MEHNFTNHKDTVHGTCEIIHNKNVSKSRINSKRLHCAYCDKKFNKKETYNKHIKTTHEGQHHENSENSENNGRSKISNNKNSK